MNGTLRAARRLAGRSHMSVFMAMTSVAGRKAISRSLIFRLQSVSVISALAGVANMEIATRTSIDAATCGPPRMLQVRMLQDRSEEHTSELQSRLHLVCRLLLE